MAAEVEIIGWKMNQAPFVGLSRRDNRTSQYRNSFPSWVLPQYRSDAYFRMKRSSATVDPPPQCALSPQDATLLGNSHRLGKDNKSYPFSPVNRGSGRNPRPMQRQLKREPQPVNQAWSNNTFENSNTSWEGDWSNASSTPPIKTEPSPTGYYNHRNTGSFQSSSEWSPGESSASSSMMPSAYGMMHTTPQQSPSNSSLSASSSSYYESNGFYGSGYNYGQSGYMQAPYGTASQQQHQYHESVRTFDGAAGSYNHRNPSSCPQTLLKQPIPDYQRKQTRYPMDGVSRVQIKREPEDYNEVDGENFTSLFTKSLTSLYSQDTENAFAEEHKPYEPDLMVCSPVSLPGIEEHSTYQRLSTSGGQYNVNTATDYQDGRSNNFGFYESRAQNCEPPQPSVSVVEELGSDGDRMNSFRYDRPSFDDMHLYTSPPNETKSQAKKRKINMPSATPESGYPGTENRKKTPRIVPSYKSDSQWTPNSFTFSDIQIKQEPIDDYSTNEMDTPSCSGLPFKESSPSSNGTGGNGNKSPGQQPDHPKQPPRKRSPGATCFDRFDKKSTPTNKKVSPLSVYAKVQENIVLSVKCRRYKKRTKPITSKEESICPGREEMELYKQNSLTPDQAAHQVMSELLERVSLFEERSVIDGPNLTQMDAMKVRELLMQFCHRYSLDYRDFEDINSVLKPRIINDNFAKNSERASAIRKRTSTSPVQREVEPQPVRKTSSRAERVTKKASVEETKPAERRVLRSLPGRVDRGDQARYVSNRESVVGRRYSTRSGRDFNGEKSTQVDIIISSSTESESEASKEAEVRKKSQRLKKKTPAAVTPARSRTSSKASSVKSTERVEKRVCTRSRENKDMVKMVDVPDTNINRINLRSRRDRVFRKDSTDSMRSSSVEILDITKNDRSSLDDIIDAVIAKPFSDKSEKNCRKASKPSVKNKGSLKEADKSPASKRKTLKNSTRNSVVKKHANSPSPEVMNSEKEDSIVFLNSPDQPKGRSRKTTHKRRTRRNADVDVNSACDTSDVEEVEPLQKLKESSRKLKSNVKNSETKDLMNSASCDVIIVKEEFSPKQLKNTSKNSSLKNNFDKSLPAKDLVNLKSHFSAINVKEHFPNQLDTEFTQLSSTNSSKSSKTLKNDKVQIDLPFLRLSDDFKVHQEVTTSKTAKTRSLSNSTKPSKLLKNNYKKSDVDSQLIDTSDASKQQNSDKSFILHPVFSKSSKQPKGISVTSSESCVEPNESLKVLKDLEKSVTTKSLPETSKSRKMSEDDVKISIDSPAKSCDTPKLPKVRSRKPKSPVDSTKPSKFKIDVSNKSFDPSVEAIDVAKLLTDNPKKTLASQPEVIKSPKPPKENTKNSADSLVEPSNILEPSKEMPRKSKAVTLVQEPRVSSKVSCRKVDDLVAAVSSLVESEKESKLLENDKKTIAAHSLLELGNSPQFLKVGSISTPVHRSSKSEIIDRVSPVSKSLSNLTSSSDSTTSTDSWKFVKKNYEKPEVISLACNNSAGHDKPVTTNTPFAYYNTTSYEKPVAANTPYIYRNSEKYEKQVAVNTPFIYRNSGNYEKPVAVNTPHIYRNSENYEKPVAVNTPYIYRNSENPAVANSSPFRNSQRLRKVRDKRPVRIDSSSDIDKPYSLIDTSDAINSLQKSREDHVPTSASRVHSQLSTSLPAAKDSKATPDSNGSKGPCMLNSSFPVEDPLNCVEVKNKKLERFSHSPSKLTLLRSCSQLSDSEPQVVLTKLPDVHVNSKDGSVSAEVVKLCEMTEGRNSSLTRKHKSKSLKCVDKPPVLVSMKAVDERASSPTSSLSTSPPCIHSLDDTDLPVNLSTALPSSEKTRHSTEVVPRLRSESEDSDCGLVIDLDRRTSIEERVPSPTLQSSDIIDGMKKASVSEDPRSFFSDQPVPSTSNDGTDRSTEEKEASHTLLELTRSMLPPMSSSLTEDSDDNFSSAESEERRRGRRAREVRERARDESILRTLLLETGAIGPSQDRSQPGSDSSTISADSKDPITQEITRLLLLCETNDEDSLSESTSIDDRKFPLEIITDLNANSLITDLEADHQDIKEQIRKLKNEIVYLKCIADKKDRERTAVVCFKRYKEEILKRILKRFTFNLNDHMQEWITSNPKIPIDTTDSVDFQHVSSAHSSHSDDATHLHASPRRQVLQLAYHATIETDLPAATVMSSECHSPQCDDNYPTVIAKATASVGIDMRTVNRNGSSTTSTRTSTSKTILQAVLSSRESIGSPCTSGSSLSEEAIEGSVQIIQQTTSTTRESTFGTTDSSPLSMPDLSPRRNSSHRLGDNVFSRHLSQSPPFLQSEFGASENSAFSATSSTSQNRYPIPLVVSERKIKSARKVHSYTTTSNSRPPSSHSSTPSRHIPSSSYSLWSRDRIARNSFAAASMDYQTDRTETISSTMGSSYINRFSSSAFMLPPHPVSNSSCHLKADGHGRKSSKTNARTYNHNTEGEQLALSYSSLMNSSSSAVSYRAPIVMGSSMVITDASGASAPSGPPKCMGCGIEDGVLLCSGCRKHWYCSPKCQNLRWPEHKNECGSASGNIYNPGPSTSYN